MNNIKEEKQVEECGCVNYCGNGLLSKYCSKHLREKINEEECKTENPNPLSLPHYVCREFFKLCPFCGECVNVFQIQETRYGGSNPYSWTLECQNMGCIFQRPNTGDLSLKHLMECWNKRY